MSTFTELQTVSNFSFLRGASHPEELVQQAATLGYSAIALTDHHSLSGVVRAHSAAKEHNISFITGCRVSLYDQIVINKNRKPEEPLETLPHTLPEHLLPFSLLLYPTSRAAYGRLSRLLTQGKRRAIKGQCVLTLQDIIEYNQGLFATIQVHHFHHQSLLNYLKQLRSIFTADRLSLAVSRTYGPDNVRHIRLTQQLAVLEHIPLIATNDVQYHCSERRILQDVLTCIRQGCTIEEAGLSLFQNAERHLKPPEEMQRLFREIPQAIARSAEVAEAAQQFSLDELRYEYPSEVCPKEKDPQSYLSELTFLGLEERYPQGAPEKVVAQINHELRLIEELNYAKYFLTVYDIVKFARSQHILCQGRGAAANSAVCYVLGITAVDPDQINLLFERFVSKERDEPPDIDIDFEHERREEVIQYIYEKYGRERAALTATVITYRSKSAVRDVGKVFDLSAEQIEQIRKLITRTDGEIRPEHIRERGLDPNDISIQHTIALSEIIRNFPRHLSQHVGGFIISETRLDEIVPIENAAMANRTVIEWDKDDIERMGMLKIDVLALGMLSCIRKAITYYNEHYAEETGNTEKAERLELHSIPAEDPAVYQMICRADTLGVFQIESRAQMSMLPRLRPKCFYDLVVEVAIVRPGPIQGGMVHPYLRRRNGQEAVEYPSKGVEKILKSTLGVPIFQEQVMELSIVAAGFTPGESDQLRRAMASWKRSQNKLLAFRSKLIRGMLQRGYSKEYAERVFQQIQGFGEYGFPQSHAASFALLVYVSSWFKCHHPALFAAALLNSQPMGFYRPAQIVDDAKRHGVEVRTVDVNHSSWDCSLEYTTTKERGDEKPALRLGMRLVRGMSRIEADRIAAARSIHRSFDSIVSLWRKSEARVSSLQLLARADAFQSLGLNRQQALWAIRKLRDEPLPLFEQIAHQSKGAQQSKTTQLSNYALPAFSDKQQVVHDYKLIGLSLKAHPMSFLRLPLAARGTRTCYEVRFDRSCAHGLRIATAGLVLVRQRPMTASGVVFVTIEDETGTANIIVKPNFFEQYRDIISDSTFLFVTGRVQREGEVVHVVLETAEDLTPTFEQSNGRTSNASDPRTTESKNNETISSRSRDFH